MSDVFQNLLGDVFHSLKEVLHILFNSVHSAAGY